MMVVGEQGVRDPSFSRGQRNEGGAYLLSLAALPSPSLKRDRYPFTAGWTGAVSLSPAARVVTHRKWSGESRRC